MIVADTTVLVDALRGRPAATAAIDAAFDRGDEVTASVVSKVEIGRGMRAHQKRDVRTLFELIQWVAVDDAVADLAGEYGRLYRASHQGIDVPDFIIAATALRAEAELWTRDVERFPMFETLEPPY